MFFPPCLVKGEQRYGRAMQQAQECNFPGLSHPPVAVTRLAGHLLSMVAMRCLGGGGATPEHSWEGDGTQGRKIPSRPLAMGRLEKSHISGQTDGLCSPPDSTGPSPDGFPATSPVTVAPPSPCGTRCYCLVGRQPHASRDLVGSLDFFFFISPLPFPPAAPSPLPTRPPAPFPMQWERKQPRGNRLV